MYVEKHNLTKKKSVTDRGCSHLLSDCPDGLRIFYQAHSSKYLPPPNNTEVEIRPKSQWTTGGQKPKSNYSTSYIIILWILTYALAYCCTELNQCTGPICLWEFRPVLVRMLFSTGFSAHSSFNAPETKTGSS